MARMLVTMDEHGKIKASMGAESLERSIEGMQNIAAAFTVTAPEHVSGLASIKEGFEAKIGMELEHLAEHTKEHQTIRDTAIRLFGVSDGAVSGWGIE